MTVTGLFQHVHVGGIKPDSAHDWLTERNGVPADSGLILNLLKFNKVESICLKGLLADAAAEDQLCKCLADTNMSQNITLINARGYRFRDFKSFMSFALTNVSVKAIDLSNCGLSHEDAEYLATDVIPRAHNISSLDLSSNPEIGEAAKSVVLAYRNSTVLTRLSLHSCGISSVGEIAAAALEHLPALEQFDIIESDGANVDEEELAVLRQLDTALQQRGNQIASENGEDHVHNTIVSGATEHEGEAQKKPAAKRSSSKHSDPASRSASNKTSRSNSTAANRGQSPRVASASQRGASPAACGTLDSVDMEEENRRWKETRAKYNQYIRAPGSSATRQSTSAFSQKTLQQLQPKFLFGKRVEQIKEHASPAFKSQGRKTDVDNYSSTADIKKYAPWNTGQQVKMSPGSLYEIEVPVSPARARHDRSATPGSTRKIKILDGGVQSFIEDDTRDIGYLARKAKHEHIKPSPSFTSGERREVRFAPTPFDKGYVTKRPQAPGVGTYKPESCFETVIRKAKDRPANSAAFGTTQQKELSALVTKGVAPGPGSYEIP